MRIVALSSAEIKELFRIFTTGKAGNDRVSGLKILLRRP